MEVESLTLIEIEELDGVAECLKLLAHPLRLRLVDILLQGAFPVGTLAELCELAPHQTSEHLRLMQRHGLLSSRREGRQVFYEVASAQLPDLMTCIRAHCGRS